jgi:hypothetical protein
LEKETICRLATALKAFPHAAGGDFLVDTIADAVLLEKDSPVVCKTLHGAVQSLAPYVLGGAAAFYRQLVDRLRTTKGFWKRQYLLCALLAIGLGATPPATAQMAELARDLTEDLAKRSKKRIFAFVDRESRDWPDEARLRWNLFAKFVRPNSLLKRLARACARTAGVAIGLVCLAFATSRISCRSESAGTAVATQTPALPQIASGELATGANHDRSQP